MSGEHDEVREVLIVGAGIAGLSLALALRLKDIPCVAVDIDGRAEGASIALTNRAVDVLAELGVLDDCAAAGTALRETVFASMFDQAGEPLPAPPIRVRESPLPASVVIDRPSLHRILRTHAERAGAVIRTGMSITGLDEDAVSVTARFTDGTTGRYGLVVGADGIRSQVRRLLHGDSAEPKYTGHMSLRWALRDAPEGPAGFYNGPGGATFVIARPAGSTAYITTGLDLPNVRMSQEEARDLVRKNLDLFTAPFLAALRERLTADEEIMVRPFEWLLVPPPWHRGRVTLVGDAAHATTPHLASGGGMALEDAVVLAEELDAKETVSAALGGFMRRRIDRVCTVVRTSVELLHLYETQDMPAMARARAEAMAVLSAPY